MIAYLALLGAGIGGLAGSGLWVIGIATIALAALSRAEYHHLYERAAELGHDEAVFSTTLQSFANAFIASGVAYAGGIAFRLL